jgi:hypothetical protein
LIWIRKFWNKSPGGGHSVPYQIGNLMAEVYDASTPRGGGMEVRCSRSETETIGAVGSVVADWIWIFTGLLPNWAIKSIRLSAALLAWKARRCLKHGKAVGFVIGGALIFPFEHDPNVPPKRNDSANPYWRT